jgi:hypothetical protein
MCQWFNVSMWQCIDELIFWNEIILKWDFYMNGFLAPIEPVAPPRRAKGESGNMVY